MTLYFQTQFIKVHCTDKKCHKMLIKKGAILSKVAEKFESKRRKYYENLGNKRYVVRQRYYNKKEFVKR